MTALAGRRSRQPPARCAPGDAPDAGSATVEFVFLGVVLMVPLLYLVIAVAEVQRNAFAVTQAAREAGRALTAPPAPVTTPPGADGPFGSAAPTGPAATADLADAVARAEYAVHLALVDQGLEGGAELRLGPVGSACTGPGLADLAPGSDVEVCVVRRFRAPGVPGFLDAGQNTVTGRYLIHVDDFRAAGGPR